MSLLLDTNILIAITEKQTDRLGWPIRHAIEDEGALLWASVASLWEIAIKAGIGKLPISTRPSDLPPLLTDIGLNLLSIHPAHVLHDLDPLPPTRDPFDRLLLAQCALERLRLVTLDRALVDHPLAWRPA